jgi:cytochrome c oxidase cbb3-type subunit III
VSTVYRSFDTLVCVLALLLGCDREQRRFSEIAPLSAPALGTPHSGIAPVAPGAQGALPHSTATAVEGMYDGNAWAVSEGKRLFTAFNCNGCHGQGGGGEGPALMDRRHRYGSEAGNVFASIIEGRPNGMPSFRHKLTEQQTWQLVAYVRALSGLVRLDVQPSRSDTLSGHPPELILRQRGPLPPRPEGVP